MKSVKQTNRFLKDLKKAFKRGKDHKKLTAIVELLVHGEELPIKCRPHKLTGNWNNFWECHIEPDWLLIYDFDDDYVYLERTGNHSDLFK